MRHLGFDGEPSDEVLDRLSKANGYCMLGDLGLLKKYLRARLREEKVSIYRLADVTGWSRTTIANALTKGLSMSMEKLTTIMWIVDGGTDRWNEYQREHEGR